MQAELLNQEGLIEQKVMNESPRDRAANWPIGANFGSHFLYFALKIRLLDLLDLATRLAFYFLFKNKMLHTCITND